MVLVLRGVMVLVLDKMVSNQSLLLTIKHCCINKRGNADFLTKFTIWNSYGINMTPQKISFAVFFIHIHRLEKPVI
jgi:hypothetical protein